MAHEQTELVVYKQAEVPATYVKKTRVTEDPPIVEGRPVGRREKKRPASKKGWRGFRLLRVKWRAFKRSPIWRRLRVRSKLAWRSVKRSPVVQSKGLVWGIISLLLSFGLLWWGVHSLLAREAGMFHSLSFLMKYAWWGLGLVAVIVFIYFLAKMGWHPSTTTLKKFPVGAFFKWVLPIAAVVAFIVFLPDIVTWVVSRVNLKANMPPSAARPLSHETILVGHNWTPSKRVPGGTKVLWTHHENVEYEVRIPLDSYGRSFKTYRHKRHNDSERKDACDENFWIPERMTAFQIRLSPKENLKETTFDLDWYEYGSGSPCGTAETGAEEVRETSSVPHLPQGDSSGIPALLPQAALPEPPR